MELRKDPITRTWVRIGHRESTPLPPGGCPLCPERSVTSTTLLSCGAAGHVRVIPHFDPLYRIEFEPGRVPEGIYDCMRPVGAHEIIFTRRSTPNRSAQRATARSNACWTR